jgi:acyl dehydratase
MEFKAGDIYDLGDISLTEEEIIAFAKAFDPLDFHTDKEAAKKSYFKDLIASGPHLFNLIHRTKWIPLFGRTVVCGLEVSHWKFLKPVFAGMKVHSKVTVLEAKPTSDPKLVTVKWLYEFTSGKGELVQSLDMTVLHKIL